MPRLTRQEFLRHAKHRLGSQNRGGIVPVPPRIFSLGSLWNYAGLDRPMEDIAGKIRLVVGQDYPEAILTLPQVQSFVSVDGTILVRRAGHADIPLFGPSQDGQQWAVVVVEEDYECLRESLSLGHVVPAATLAAQCDGPEGRFTAFFANVIRAAGIELGLDQQASTATIMRHVQNRVPGANRSIRNFLPDYLQAHPNLQPCVQAGCQAWMAFTAAEQFVLQQRGLNVGQAAIVMPQV